MADGASLAALGESPLLSSPIFWRRDEGQNDSDVYQDGKSRL